MSHITRKTGKTRLVGNVHEASTVKPSPRAPRKFRQDYTPMSLWPVTARTFDAFEPLSDCYEVLYQIPGKPWRRAFLNGIHIRAACDKWIAEFRRINPPYVGTKFRIVLCERRTIEEITW